jgi:hypothetical protein
LQKDQQMAFHQKANAEAEHIVIDGNIALPLEKWIETCNERGLLRI